MVDLEQKRAAVKKLVTFGVIVGGAALTASIAWYAVIGLVGWATAAGIWLLVSNFAPAIGDWFAAKKIQAIKAVAAANPIETMESLYGEKSQELVVAEQNLVTFDKEIHNFLDVVKGLERDQPEDAPIYRELYDKMVNGMRIMQEELSKAREELADFLSKIKRAKAIYRASQAANRILSISEQATNDQIFAHIKEEVAFDTVQSSLNTTFASLNQVMERKKDLANAKKPKQLSAPLPTVIDLGKVGARVQVKG